VVTERAAPRYIERSANAPKRVKPERKTEEKSA
jgi:hypothetical protein